MKSAEANVQAQEANVEAAELNIDSHGPISD